MTDQQPETLSSESTGPFPPLRRERRSLPLGSRLTAMTASLSLVLVGGVATAAYRAAQGSTAPTELIPASAFAVAMADLSLPGQGDAARHFADVFPDSPTHHGSGSVTDRVLAAMFKDSSDPHVDYASEIKPWLGDHVAVAGWTDSAGRPQAEFLLQSRDDGSARSHLKHLIAESGAGEGFVIAHGYAVLASSTAKAQAAVDAAATKSLGDNASFTNDVGGLPDDEFALAWADGAAVTKVLLSTLGRRVGGAPFGASGPFGPFGMLGLGSKAATAMKGRFAAGLHFADDYVQLDVRSVNAKPTKSGPSTLLTQLPAGTVAAIELGDTTPIASAVTQLAGIFGGLSASASMGLTCTAAPVPLGALPVVPPNAPHRRLLLRKLRLLRQQMRQEQRAARRNGNTCHPGKPAKPVDPLQQITRATGLQLPQDLSALLGDHAVVAYGGLEIGSLPDIAVRSHPTDIGAAQDAAGRLTAGLAKSAHLSLASRTTGGDLVVATSQPYADAVAATGTLGKQALAAKALGDIPDDVGVAAFVDLSRIWPIAGNDVPRDVGHLKAIGFWSGQDGSVQTGQLRLVVG